MSKTVFPKEQQQVEEELDVSKSSRNNKNIKTKQTTKTNYMFKIKNQIIKGQHTIIALTIFYNSGTHKQTIILKKSKIIKLPTSSLSWTWQKNEKQKLDSTYHFWHGGHDCFQISSIFKINEMEFVCHALKYNEIIENHNTYKWVEIISISKSKKKNHSIITCAWQFSDNY